MSKIISREKFLKITRMKKPVGLKLTRFGKIFQRDIDADRAEAKKNNSSSVVGLIKNLFTKKD